MKLRKREIKRKGPGGRKAENAKYIRSFFPFQPLMFAPVSSCFVFSRDTGISMNGFQIPVSANSLFTKLLLLTARHEADCTEKLLCDTLRLISPYTTKPPFFWLVPTGI